MLFREFSAQFAGLGDEFLVHFSRPFLLEEGRLPFEEEGSDSSSDQQLFYLHGDRKEPLVVGRSSQADVTIPETNVSSRHLELRPGPAPGVPWSVVDLGSTNGTFLNGSQLAQGVPKPLKDESVLGLGPSALFVFLEPQTFLQLMRRRLDKEGSPTGSGSLSLGSETQHALPRAALDDVSSGERLPRATSTVAGVERLYLICEPFDRVPLEPDEPVVIGRSDIHANLVLPHPQVSRRHAELVLRDDTIWLRDFQSANGTWIGETRVGSKPVEVLPGKPIRIADFKLVVEGQFSDSQVGTIVSKPQRRFLRGDLSKTSLEDLLLSIEERQKSGLLEVFGFEANGRMTFLAGRPHRAEADGGRSGATAIAHLLQKLNHQGSFRIDPSAERVGERKIEKSFADIVLEAFLEE